MADREVTRLVYTLQEEIGDLRKQIKTLQSAPALRNASIEDTSIPVVDRDGNITSVIGRQSDGSSGVSVRRSPFQPMPTAPILNAAEQAGTCMAEWDGGTHFPEDVVPVIFGKIEIWAVLLGEGEGPHTAPNPGALRVGSIREREGGEVTITLPKAGMWGVWFRMVGADGDRTSDWSPVSTVEITGQVDTAPIKAELADARDRLAQAEADLASGMAERKAEIDYLRETRIPELQDALATGLTDVHAQAEALAEAARDDAVNQAAANAQSEYDRLQELAERALSRAGDNLAEDPGFETQYWPGEWDGTGGRVVRTTATSRTGDQGLLIEQSSTTTDLPFPDVNVELDQSYRLSIWYRTWPNSAVDLSDGMSALVFYDSETGLELAASEPLTAGTIWRRAEVMYTIPEDVRSIRPAIRASWDGHFLIFDDVSLREVGAAVEALRQAELARQLAEDAHIAAGEATDAAALAYDAASSKSTVHWSLSAPSGTADNSDDVWWQYELRNGRRVVIGQWFWDDGVWRETEIAEEWLPLVNIGTGTYGDLDGVRIRSDTIEVRHLSVGFSPDNLILDPRLRSIPTDGSNPEQPWQRVTGPVGAWRREDTTRGPALNITGPRANGLDSRMEYRHTTGSGVLVNPGEEFVLTFQGRNTTEGNLRALVRRRSASNTTLQSVVLGTISGDWDNYTFTYRVPDTIDEGQFVALDFHLQPGAVSGTAHIAKLRFRQRVDRVDISDGAVTSPKVNTEEFFAAEAVIQKIWTDIVRARLIESQGIITEDMIATGAITTPKLTVTEEMAAEVVKVMRLEGDEMAFNVIRGMIVQAAQIEGSVFLAEDANGQTTIRLDGMDNLLMGRLHAGMTEGAGITMDYGEQVLNIGENDEGEPDQTITWTAPYMEFEASGDYDQYPRLTIDPNNGGIRLFPGTPTGTHRFRGKLNVSGDVRANRLEARDSMSAWTGYHLPRSSNQPGGLTMDSSLRTRLLGRMAVSHGPHDMIMRGSSNETTTDPGTGSRGTLTFDAPSPTGVRVCTVSGHVANTSWGYDNNRVINVSSAAASASSMRFTRRAPSDNNGPVQSWVYYFAYWV